MTKCLKQASGEKKAEHHYACLSLGLFAVARQHDPCEHTENGIHLAGWELSHGRNSTDQLGMGDDRKDVAERNDTSAGQKSGTDGPWEGTWKGAWEGA